MCEWTQMKSAQLGSDQCDFSADPTEAIKLFVKKKKKSGYYFKPLWFGLVSDPARADNIRKKNSRCYIVTWIFTRVVNFMTMITYFWEYLFWFVYKVIYSSLSISERKQNQNGRSN